MTQRAQKMRQMRRWKSSTAGGKPKTVPEYV